MAAQILFDFATHEAVVLGDNAANFVHVTEEHHDELTVTITTGAVTIQRVFDEDLVSRVRFEGRAGNDRFLNDTHKASFVRAGLGNDIIVGGHGDDILSGGEGNDLIAGRHGNDFIYGLGGNDTAYGGWGDDAVYGGIGNDRIYGGPGRDVLAGGIGTNIIFRDHDDILVASVGIDFFFQDSHDLDPFD